MKQVATAFAPGKLILAGEHAVVYGHLALAVAVDRGTRVRVWRRPGPSGLDVGSDLDDPRLVPALAAILPQEGVGVQIWSDLPIGRGMGSSAALAVALVRALAELEGRCAGHDECVARGFAMERVFHGTPSGLDHTVSSLGGCIAYRRGPGGVEVERVIAPTLSLVVLDSGSAGDTAALVGGVASRRPGIDPVLAEIGALAAEVRALLLAVSDPDEAARQLGPLLFENHRLLQKIGVSTPALDGLVELARDAGATGAKLAGAGGGGVVLALIAGDPAPLLAAAAAQGVNAFPARLAPAQQEP